MAHDGPGTTDLGLCLCAAFFPRDDVRWAQLLVSPLKWRCLHFSINIHSKQINNKNSLKMMEGYFPHIKMRLKFDNPRLVGKLFWYHKGPRLSSFSCNVFSLLLLPHGPRWLLKFQPSHLHPSHQKRKRTDTCCWPELCYLATSSHTREWEM